MFQPKTACFRGKTKGVLARSGVEFDPQDTFQAENGRSEALGTSLHNQHAEPHTARTVAVRMILRHGSNNDCKTYCHPADASDCICTAHHVRSG